MAAHAAGKTQGFFHQFELCAFVGSACGHGFKGHAHGVGLHLIENAVPDAQKRETAGSMTGQLFLGDVHNACHKGKFMHEDGL